MKNKLIKYGHILAKKKLVWGNSGNISMKSEPDAFFISAGGTNLGKLTDDDIICCGMDGGVINGKKRPSMETGMHRSIYGKCSDAAAVIHSQPFYSTLAACSNLNIRTDILPEAMAYLGKIERVSYFHAGSSDLAKAVADKAKDSPVLLLENHGVVCWGTSLDDALLKTETLEFLCRLLVVSNSSDIDLNNLGENVMNDFISHLKSIGLKK
jgi:ribulose-5-phosphate 4-epimerase/fuculose-1-phosphate aldolase